MTASRNDHRQRVDAIFDAVLDLPDAEQMPWIDRACGEDAALRQEVLELLHAHQRTAGILEVPVHRLAAMADEGVPAEPVPERIGPFRVVRAIGEGGMGQVFLGERARRWTSIASCWASGTSPWRTTMASSPRSGTNWAIPQAPSGTCGARSRCTASCWVTGISTP